MSSCRSEWVDRGCVNMCQHVCFVLMCVILCLGWGYVSVCVYIGACMCVNVCTSVNLQVFAAVVGLYGIACTYVSEC